MAQYLIVHKDSPLHIHAPNGGAEMVSLYLAKYLAAAGETVAVAARLQGPEESDGRVEYWDLGDDYDVEKAIERARLRGQYHLISNGHVLALFLSRHDPLCLSRILHTGERSGAAGMGMDVVCKVVDSVACVSHAQREMFIKEGAAPTKAEVIYNGVDSERYAAGDSSKRNWRRMVFAGALVQDKGIHVLIEAFAQLKQKYQDLSLDVYGSARLWHRAEFLNQQELENSLPGLKFHGSVDGTVLAEAYRGAGICVVPSIWFEPFGMVASDALATGCPVVTFAVGGPAEVVQDQKNGVVIQEISTDSLVRTLDQLLGDQNRLQALAQGALETRARFSWEKAVSEYQALCRRFASTRKASSNLTIRAPHQESSLPALSDSPLISVITVSFNQAEFIRDTIESVVSQDYENFEHIIVDAGSTDGTLDILKEYPHLQWTSEPDRGQSHGLNKGFSRAKGDIIVWLNSDDWLAPDCFKNIAPALKEHGTVIASAAKTDRTGNVEEIVPNVARHWADLLKFWVPYAWFAQTSIFFRRDFLESVKLPNGDFLDEDLFFTMDIDLWMRMAKKQPFLNRIDHVCSYYRIYEDNKTGEDGPAAQRECSRLFRRHCNSGELAERRYSVLIPMQSTSDDILTSIESIAQQQLPDVEILLIAQGEDINRRTFRKMAGELDEKIAPFCVRPVFAQGKSTLESLNLGVNRSAGRFTVFMSPGDTLGADYFKNLERLFVYDWVGVAVPSGGNSELAAALGEGTPGVTVTGILSAPILSPVMAVRTVALRDLKGFKSTAAPMIGVRELLLRALYKSWHVVVDESLHYQQKGPDEAGEKLFRAFEFYIAAKLITELDEERQNDPFFVAKQEHGNAIIFAPELVQGSQSALDSAPADWDSCDFSTDQDTLKSIVNRYPNFAPAWFLLSESLAKSGATVESKEALERYKTLSPQM